jgi:hypothetical protein
LIFGAKRTVMLFLVLENLLSIEIGITPSSEKTAKLTAPLLTPNRCFINLICTLTGGKGHVWENQNTFSKNKLLNAIYNKLSDNFISYWKREL